MCDEHSPRRSLNERLYRSGRYRARQRPAASGGHCATAGPNLGDRYSGQRTWPIRRMLLPRAGDRQLGRTSIAFTFDIDAAGKPTTVDLQYRNRMDDSAKECMRYAALRVAFPPTMQGRQTGTLAFEPTP